MVNKGQKMTGRNQEGKPTFTEDQVKYTGIFRNLDPNNTASPTVTVTPIEITEEDIDRMVARGAPPPAGVPDGEDMIRRREREAVYAAIMMGQERRDAGFLLRDAVTGEVVNAVDDDADQIEERATRELAAVLRNGMDDGDIDHIRPKLKKKKKVKEAQDHSGFGGGRNIQL